METQKLNQIMKYICWFSGE